MSACGKSNPPTSSSSRPAVLSCCPVTILWQVLIIGAAIVQIGLAGAGNIPASGAQSQSLFIPAKTINLDVGDQSALAQAVSQLVPRRWFHFTVAENSSWNGGAVLQLPYASSDNATSWSTKGMWNEATHEFYFLGGVHCGSGNCPQSTEVVRYDEANNTWSVNSNNSAGHAYEGAALSSSAYHNKIYFRPYLSNTVQIYDLSSQSWQGSLTPIKSSGPDCCLAQEYFPDRDSLITIDNDWGLFEYSFSSGKWSECLIGTTQPGCGATHLMCGASSTSAPWARYDPAQHRMLFGGCTHVYALSKHLKLAELASSPFNLSAGPSGSPVTIDPRTGQLVSWDASGNTFTSDGEHWVNLGPSPFSDPVHNGLACAPVSTYNVIMCLYAGFSGRPVTNGAVWLYKLGGSSGPPGPKVEETRPVPTAQARAASSNATTMTHAGPTAITTVPPGTGPVNGWRSRISGVNVPGGAASIISSQGFDTFPQNNLQQYFKLYEPDSITTDCSIAADGCSLKFAVLKGYKQGEPGWFDWNFSRDLSRTFGEGQEFYVQYRERLDPAMLIGGNFPNGEGFKHDIITEGDISGKIAGDCSNSPGEVVLVQDGNGATYPGLYHNCGFSGGSVAFIRSGYELIQLGGITGSNFLDQNIAGCPHYAGRGILISDPTCFKYVANEWFTVQIHVKVGLFGQPNSVLEVWLAHQGKPAQLVINAADAALINDGSGGASGKYGKIQLSAYNTAMSGSLVNTAVWFDDLVVSTRRIPDPDVATPNAPDSLNLSDVTTNSVTLKWRVNSQSGTPQDDTGFLVERCTGDGAHCFPNPQGGFRQIATTAPGAISFVDSTVAHGETYTYRIRAKNSAGNSPYAASQCFNGKTTCGGTAEIPKARQ